MEDIVIVIIIIAGIDVVVIIVCRTRVLSISSTSTETCWIVIYNGCTSSISSIATCVSRDVVEVFVANLRNTI